MAPPIQSLPRAILIVESEALIRMALQAQLVDAGLITFVAGSADGAIAILNLHTSIGLMVTDVIMDGSMDGLRWAPFVRDRWPPIKTVVVSGRLGTRLGDLPLGSMLFPKPYEPDARLAAIGPLVHASQ